LRLGFFPNLTHAQALVGNAEGTFQQALGGRPLEVKQFTAGSSAMEALLAGSLDVCYLGSGPAITAWVRAPGSIHIISGSASGGAAFVVRELHDPLELRGKRVASPQLGNSQDIALRFWLRNRGLKVTSTFGDRHAVTVTPLANPDIMVLFRRGELAGAWVPEPWASRLMAEAGGRLLLDERDLWPDGRFPTTVLVATKEALTYRRREVQELLKAHLRLTALARSQPADFARRANEAYGALTHHPLDEGVLRSAMGRIEFESELLEPQLRAAAEHARELGFLPTANIDGLLDSSLLQEAATQER
jgi:NitT/TauT family transport system substrate-binding protein